MNPSYVVTGGGSGVGRVIAERLLADGCSVVVLDRDNAALGWTLSHPAGRRVIALAGDAADDAVTERAADLATEAGGLAGWVNNAAVFQDAWLHAAAARDVVDLITANLALAVTGCGGSWRAGPAARSSMSPPIRRSGQFAARCPTRQAKLRSRA
jgi:NAD(P)-dependent dehydrogenase (short-subunit alcohol dehydrogenase family)